MNQMKWTIITYHVSKLLNFLVTTLPRSIPRRSTIRCASSGCEVPLNTLMFGILDTNDRGGAFKTSLDFDCKLVSLLSSSDVRNNTETVTGSRSADNIGKLNLYSTSTRVILHKFDNVATIKLISNIKIYFQQNYCDNR